MAEQAEGLRWNPPDRPYHMLGGEHFAEVLRLLDGRGDPWQRDDDGLDAEIDARFEACFRAPAAAAGRDVDAGPPVHLWTLD
ncbi:hypothetical protein GCM10023191_056700 [Actinoallomurus oryzae]|uniref:Uncharacterized protein n=1 Tax=Actinoallomurus oryzae TaxID=502180 RepID=A0ABP8QJG6_9ACTN